MHTLTQLQQDGYGLIATCPNCQYRMDLNMDELIAWLGAEFVFMAGRVDPRIRCPDCGGRGALVQIHSLRFIKEHS